MSQQQQLQQLTHQQQQERTYNLSNISCCSSANGNTSSSSLNTSAVGCGIITTQNISTVIKPKENNNSMQFVKITPPDLSKKAVEQIRVARESKITKDKLKEVEEEWQSNLMNWKLKRRQQYVGPPQNEEQQNEQNNNDPENAGGRKVKTFAQIIEQRSKSNNRLKFNLQRYIESSDEEPASRETSPRRGDQEQGDQSEQPPSDNEDRCAEDKIIINDNTHETANQQPEQQLREVVAPHERQKPVREIHKIFQQLVYQEHSIIPQIKHKPTTGNNTPPLKKDEIDPPKPASPEPIQDHDVRKSPSLSQSITPSSRGSSPPTSPPQKDSSPPPPPPPPRDQTKLLRSVCKPQLSPQPAVIMQPMLQQQPQISPQLKPRPQPIPELKQQPTQQRPMSQPLTAPKPLAKPQSCSPPQPSPKIQRKPAPQPQPLLQSQEISQTQAKPSPTMTPNITMQPQARTQSSPAPTPPVRQKEDKDRTVLSVSGKRRCSSCKEELGRGAAAFVVESLNLVYHTNCFKCSVCHVDLANGFRGVDVRVHAGALHCQNCYSKDGLNYSRV